MAVYTNEMEEITNLLKLVEAADFAPDMKHIMIRSGITIVSSDDESRVIGTLVAIDGGIWSFEAAAD